MVRAGMGLFTEEFDPWRLTAVGGLEISLPTCPA